MKKSKYINKYDYIGFYTKQPSFWFFSNSEILASINTELKKLSLMNDLEDESEEDDNFEFDTYEYYKEQKELLKDVDKNDPKIFEGIIIDNKSRQFIIEQYKNIKTIIDFEDKKYTCYNQEKIAELTKEAILNNKECILFQPVFIYNNLITKPDAIIKNDEEIILIETKSTTTSKKHHFLDIYFQYQVLSNIEYLNDFYFNLNICLVAYCYANRNEVKFIISDCFNITSSYSKKTDNVVWKQLIKMGKGFIDAKEGFVESPITFNAVCNKELDELENRKDLAPRSRKSIEEAQQKILEIYNEFNSVIKILIEHKQKLLNDNIDYIKSIEVSSNEKSYWKKSDLFPKLREIYAKQGYELFLYSGNIAYQTAEHIDKFIKDPNIENFFKKDDYNLYFINNNKTLLNHSTLNTFLDNLKPKKVYFDFETINSPIRPIEHCLPFMQILTQCSVIIDDNTKPINQVECNNILIDPINIQIQDFKNIIDALHHGNDYSYVVYNKSFECTRLKEMANFINEEEYYNKVNNINNNIYDLADFFKVNSSQFKCPIIIPELYGFYSIKKVLPIVMNKRIDIFNNTGCVDYHSLDVVQNGLICQSETTKRFHNLLTNQEWDKLSFNLKKYCENDVRAMVAVEYYIKSLVTN